MRQMRSMLTEWTSRCSLESGRTRGDDCSNSRPPYEDGTDQDVALELPTEEQYPEGVHSDDLRNCYELMHHGYVTVDEAPLTWKTCDQYANQS